MTRTSRLSTIGLYAIMTAIGALFLFPFYTMVVGSFMVREQLYSLSPNIWPNPFILSNYVDLFKAMPFHRYIFNSFMVAGGQTIGVLFFCSLAAFTFAKRRFPGKEWLFVVLLVTLMIPRQTTLIPWFLLMSSLGWINTYLPLWLPWWAPAFGIFLMRQYIVSTVPDDLVEAATMDGASLFGIYWRVVLPVVAPGLIVLGLLNFFNAWNDFLYSLLVFGNEQSRTAPLGLALFRGSEVNSPRYTVMFAGSVLATVPLLAIFFAFQRRLMEGIMAGAIKG